MLNAPPSTSLPRLPNELARSWEEIKLSNKSGLSPTAASAPLSASSCPAQPSTGGTSTMMRH